MKASPRSLLLAAGVVLSTAGCIQIYPPEASAARSAGKAQSGPAGKEDGDKKGSSPYKKWDETVKDAEVRKGLFNLYERRGTLLMEIPKTGLERDLLLVTSVSKGIGEGFQTLGGMPLDTALVRFRRRGDVVQVIEPNVRAAGPSGSAVEKSVELSYGPSVVAALKIESENAETGALLVDSTGLWLSDAVGLAAAMKDQFRSGFSFDKERSSLAFAKAFPENLEIEVDNTYATSEPRPGQLETVPDRRYVPIGVHYSLSSLPENDYRPRLADDRVGFFLTVHKDFTRDDEPSFFVRYINRWDLRPSDPSKPVSDAKNPVVWYLENSIPPEYRKAVRDGILEWNRAFEKAGLANAMVVKDQPDNPDFDPTDVRYNTIRWITSSVPAFGAIGPSRADPRTGQLLDADILIEASMVQGFRSGWRTWVRSDRAAVVPSEYDLERPAGEPAEPTADGRLLQCSLGHGLMDGGALLAQVLRAEGVIGPHDPVPDQYVYDALKWVTMHEVGHTLGLRHNFRASIDVPVEKLHDTAFTRDRGLYSSVMDYAAPNVARRGSRQGDYYSATVGTYDLWAIEYGYRPIAADSIAAERPALDKIAARSSEPGHAYGTDEDAFHFTAAPLGVDPDVNTWDLGADPLTFAETQIALVDGLWDRLPERTVAAGDSYDRLRSAFSMMLSQKATALAIASKQIGGQSVHRDHRGDPGARPPFVPISPARQRRALDLLTTSAFSAGAFEFPPEMLNDLAPSRWFHWGTGQGLGSGNMRIDYPLHDNVLAIQSMLLGRLMHPVLLARVQDASLKAKDPLRLSELFAGLNGAVFSELDSSPRAGKEYVPSFRRNLQRSMIEREIKLVVAPDPGTPEDARSLARLHLGRVAGRMGDALRASGLDDTSRAHLEESKVRIERALEAQMAIPSVPPAPSSGQTDPRG